MAVTSRERGRWWKIAVKRCALRTGTNTSYFTQNDHTSFSTPRISSMIHAARLQGSRQNSRILQSSKTQRPRHCHVSKQPAQFSSGGVCALSSDFPSAAGVGLLGRSSFVRRSGLALRRRSGLLLRRFLSLSRSASRSRSSRSRSRSRSRISLSLSRSSRRRGLRERSRRSLRGGGDRRS